MIKRFYILLIPLGILVSCGSEGESSESADPTIEESPDSFEAKDLFMTGRIDDQYDFNMEVFVDGDGSAKGSYYYHTVGKRIDLIGSFKNGVLELTEEGDDSPESFYAKEDGEGHYEGTWKKEEGSEELKLVINELDGMKAASMNELEDALNGSGDYFAEYDNSINLKPSHAKIFLPEQYLSFSLDDDYWGGDSRAKIHGIVRKKNFILVVIETHFEVADDDMKFKGLSMATVDHYGELIDFVEVEGKFSYNDGCTWCDETKYLSDFKEDLTFGLDLKGIYNENDCDVGSGIYETYSIYAMSVFGDGKFIYDLQDSERVGDGE